MHGTCVAFGNHGCAGFFLFCLVSFLIRPFLLEDETGGVVRWERSPVNLGPCLLACVLARFLRPRGFGIGCLVRPGTAVPAHGLLVVGRMRGRQLRCLGPVVGLRLAGMAGLATSVIDPALSPDGNVMMVRMSVYGKLSGRREKTGGEKAGAGEIEILGAKRLCC